jgi:hypothetical protein
MSDAAPARRSIAALIVAATLTLVGALGAVGSWGAYNLDLGLEASGARAVGRILDKTVLRDPEGSDYILEYSFELPSGDVVTAQRSVPRELWSNFREGDTVTIVYSSSRPRRNFPLGAGVTSFGTTVFVSVISTLVGLLGAVFLWALLRGPSAARRA